MGKRIEYIEVKITPYTIARDEGKTLEVKVVVNERPYYSRHYLEMDDFDSLFDRIMDRAKSEINRMVKSHNEETNGN